jgi:hypothetical protein
MGRVGVICFLCMGKTDRFRLKTAKKDVVRSEVVEAGLVAVLGLELGVAVFLAAR